MNTPQSNSPTPPPPAEQKNNRRAIWLVILVSIVALLVLVVSIILVNRAGESQGAESTSAPPTEAMPPTSLPSTAFPTVPPSTVLPPTPAPQVPYGIANDYVNVRSGPGTNYPVYGVAAPGATAEIAGKSADNAWWVVKIPTTTAADGLGWVSADYVTVSNADNVPVIPAPAPPPDVVPPPPPSNAVVVQTTEPVNVRAGPGNEFPSYGKVPAGTPLQAQGVSQDGQWVAVSVPTSVAPAGLGWVNAAYLQPFDPNSLPVIQP